MKDSAKFTKSESEVEPIIAHKSLKPWLRNNGSLAFIAAGTRT